jgi:hypothetical protein
VAPRRRAGQTLSHVQQGCCCTPCIKVGAKTTHALSLDAGAASSKGPGWLPDDRHRGWPHAMHAYVRVSCQARLDIKIAQHCGGLLGAALLPVAARYASCGARQR